MSMEPRERGGPIQKFWDDQGTIQQLESVKTWLLKNAKKHVASEPPTAKSLSQLVQQFIQLQEDHLGRAAKNPPFTRLPVSVPFFNYIKSNLFIVCGRYNVVFISGASIL